jgi:hypothetical protein
MIGPHERYHGKYYSARFDGESIREHEGPFIRAGVETYGSSSGDCYFVHYEAAREFLLEGAAANVEYLEKQLEMSKARLARLKAKYEPAAPAPGAEGGR